MEGEFNPTKKVAFFHQFKENPDGDSSQEYQIKHKEKILTLEYIIQQQKRIQQSLAFQVDKWQYINSITLHSKNIKKSKKKVFDRNGSKKM